MTKQLRLILGDQLNASHSWFQEKNSDVIYLIAELHQEATYTRHHIQKVCAFFKAMSSFSQALRKAGHHVIYMTLDDTQHYEDLEALLLDLFDQYEIGLFCYQLPDEYRLRQQLSALANKTNVPCQSYDTEHFYLPDEQLKNYFKAQKRHRLEHFYRKMRTQFDVLIEGKEPLGGQLNFDVQNRNKFKPADLSQIPEALVFANDITDVLARVKAHKIETIGRAQTHNLWPENRAQANELLSFFCTHCLPKFGMYQDAMTGKLTVLGEDKGWSLYHSRLSFALNTKMLSPQHVVNSAIQAYKASDGKISIAQVEGFIRQIIGWREFIRGIYWANMPEYGLLNHLNADRALPSWFWTGKTNMRCISHAITQSLDYAYAHHIQRLMITGNFCLIAGIDPAAVDSWYLGIYIDALEWVEMPNTRGMSQFADGGIVGSKAYAASGNYVKKMSDYCGDCHYKVSETTTEQACPLNSLYWHFMERHQDELGNNPRTRMVYSNWHKKTVEQKSAVIDRASHLLNNLDVL